MAKQEISLLTTTAKPRFFYGYIIVAAGFSIMLVIHGTFSTFGVFFTPLQAEFGSTRAALSGASSVAFLVMGFAAILMGILADKFGPRVVLTVCSLFFGIGILLISQSSALWQLSLFFAVMGIGLSASDVVPLSIVVRWFVKKRGIMSGIMKVGTGVGMTAMPLVASVLLTTFDWRNSYRILGALVLIAAIPLAQLLRRDPHQMGLLPDGEGQPDAKSPVLAEAGLSLREAIRTRQLWMVCGFYMTILFAAQSVLVHIVPYALDLGISQTIAAGIAATIGGSSILGRLVMGFAGDRIGYKRAMVSGFIILVTALSWLQVARELWMLYLFAVIYGFAHGGFFALISPLIAGLFGTRSQGTLFGIILFSGTFAGSISPVLTGIIFDTTHSYQIAFLILLVFSIIGLVLTAFLRPISEGGANNDSERSARLS